MENLRHHVSLTDLRFYAYHGYYPEEQVLGNEFFVTIRVGFTKDLHGNDRLENTVNYERLYEIAQSEMQHPKKLLETVAEAILKQIHQAFPWVEEIAVSIRKSRPPFGGDRVASNVKLTWKNKSK